jgi:hypothetical protein
MHPRHYFSFFWWEEIRARGGDFDSVFVAFFGVTGSNFCGWRGV